MLVILETTVQQSLADRVVYEMTRRGMKQRELAAKIEKAPSWVSNFISEKLANPPEPETLRLIEEVLGISEYEVLRAYGYLQSPDEESSVAQDDDDDALVYTMLERHRGLTPYQKQIIRMALEDAARRRREAEGR